MSHPRNRAYAYFSDFFHTRDVILIAALIGLAVYMPLGLAFPTEMAPYLMVFDLLLSLVEGTEWFLHDLQRSTSRRLAIMSGLSIVPFASLAVVLSLPRPFAYLLLGTHFLRLPALIQRYQERRGSRLISRPLMVGAILGGVFLIIHFFGCAWLVLNPEWERADAVVAYNKAMYYVVTTLTTVGYGDITPTTNAGRIFAMFNMLLGVGVFGVVIGQVSQFIIESDKRKEGMKQKLEALTSLFDHYKIPPELQNEVFRFYQHVLSKKVSDDEEKVLAELPHKLQSEMTLYMNMRPISQVSLFTGVSDACLKSVAGRMVRLIMPQARPSSARVTAVLKCTSSCTAPSWFIPVMPSLHNYTPASVLGKWP